MKDLNAPGKQITENFLSEQEDLYEQCRKAYEVSRPKITDQKLQVILEKALVLFHEGVVETRESIEMYSGVKAVNLARENFEESRSIHSVFMLLLRRTLKDIGEDHVLNQLG